MYRILLADDEGIMLESLKKIIETEYGNECEKPLFGQNMKFYFQIKVY